MGKNFTKIGGYELSKNKFIRKMISEKDFFRLKVLGVGAYGKVILVKKRKVAKGENELFAMKILHKTQIIQDGVIESIVMEQVLMAGMRHPFIVGLNFTFQTEMKIFFIMDWIRGGDLHQLIEKEKILSEKQAKFYAAEILMALMHLHENCVIHRDLKPSNVLIGDDGHILLTDFGLSTFFKEKGKNPKKICGSFDYIAYEIVKNIGKKGKQQKGYTFAVDWWSFGVMIYEMVYGVCPFYHEDLQQTLRNVVHKKLAFPAKPDISSECKDLIKKLLNKNPKKRLGTKGGFSVRKHPWFKDIDFDDLYDKKVESPFKPDVSKAIELDEDDGELESDEEELTPNSKEVLKQYKKDFGRMNFRPDKKKVYGKMLEDNLKKNVDSFTIQDSVKLGNTKEGDKEEEEEKEEEEKEEEEETKE